MIVVDTNVLVHFYVAGELTPDAEAAVVKDPRWAAPLLWRSEFRSALLGFIRRGTVTVDQAMRAADDAEHRMTGREYTVVSHEVLQLAARSGCSAYDCEFVALAQDLATPLVTTDTQILKAFPSVAVALRAFVAR